MATQILDPQASDTQTPAGQATPTATKSPTSLAECTGVQQAKAIMAVLKIVALPVIAAAIQLAEGRLEVAKAWVATALHPELTAVGRVAKILSSPAPSALFVDGNNRGVKVGDLYASRLGMNKVYRTQTREAVKVAREHLKDDAR